MRKVTVFNFVTLDGYFEGPKKEISAGTGMAHKKMNMLPRISNPGARFSLDE